jgi:hypothetical protein
VRRIISNSQVVKLPLQQLPVPCPAAIGFRKFPKGNFNCYETLVKIAAKRIRWFYDDVKEPVLARIPPLRNTGGQVQTDVREPVLARGNEIQPLPLLRKETEKRNGGQVQTVLTRTISACLSQTAETAFHSLRESEPEVLPIHRSIDFRLDVSAFTEPSRTPWIEEQAAIGV